MYSIHRLPDKARDIAGRATARAAIKFEDGADRLVNDVAPRLNPVPEGIRARVKPYAGAYFKMTLCFFAFLLAFVVVSTISADLALAQTDQIAGSVKSIKDSVVTIGAAVGVLMLAVGFVMFMWPGTNERVKGAGTKVIVAAGGGLLGLGLLAAFSGMIEGWGGAGGGQ